MDNRWVLIGHWTNSSDTVHGPYRTGDEAEDAGRRAWSKLPHCTGWDVMLIDNGPVAARVSTS